MTWHSQYKTLFKKKSLLITDTLNPFFHLNTETYHTWEKFNTFIGMGWRSSLTIKYAKECFYHSSWTSIPFKLYLRPAVYLVQNTHTHKHTHTHASHMHAHRKTCIEDWLQCLTLLLLPLPSPQWWHHKSSIPTTHHVACHLQCQGAICQHCTTVTYVRNQLTLQLLPKI
jgi:hypothetical protein